MNIEKAKYRDWFKTHGWDSCGLGREASGKFLVNYIEQEREGFVLNLNGGWGTGKTEYLKRLYVEFLKNKNMATIYINAWESDFTKEPLIVIASELVSQLEMLLEQDAAAMRRMKEIFGQVLKATIVAGTGYVARNVGLNDGDAKEFVKRIVDSEPVKVADLIKDNFTSHVSSLLSVRDALGDMAEKVSRSCHHDPVKPVVVLVDELDRCRPNYAVEFLEAIKHFFSTKNFVFIVATDTGELSKSIRVLYGADFNSSIYLRRFFDRTATLSIPNVPVYAGKIAEDMFSDSLFYDEINEIISAKYLIGEVVANSATRPRDIVQILNKANAVYRQSVVDGVGRAFYPLILIMVALSHRDDGAFVRNSRAENLAKIFNTYGVIKFGEFQLHVLLLFILEFVYPLESDRGVFIFGSESCDRCCAAAQGTKDGRRGAMVIDLMQNAMTHFKVGVSGFKVASRSAGGCKFSNGMRMWVWDDYVDNINLSGELSS